MMTDTIEKCVDDLEQMLAHVPEDLDARFAGVDTKLAELREVLALHTTRFTKLERRLDVVERGLQSLDTRLGQVEMRLGQVETRLGQVETHLQQVESRVQQMEQSVTAKLDEILIRLPSPRGS